MFTINDSEYKINQKIQLIPLKASLQYYKHM